MFQNHLKTIIRNLSKNKIFTFINIAGLSIGMAACLLILQYVSFELSFDEFNEQASDLYRVGNDRYQNGKLVQHGTITYSAIGKAMQDDFPEVINHTRVEPFGSQIISWKDKKMEIKDVLAVDNSFLSMFSYPLVAGDKLNALKEPNSVVISETTAKKIFDVKDNDYQSVIGKAFVISRDSMPYKVTAICKDVPENSHLQFDCLMSYVSLYSGGNGNWKESEYDFTDSDFWHYIQLKKGTNYKLLESKFAAFSQRHFQGNKVSGSDEKFHLQPISKAHLYSDYEYEIGKTGSATVVWGLLIIALFIIAIAWVNYVNLATARSVERAKEVGIRKVAGASKGQLIRQFLAESLFVNLIALLIALGLVWVLQDSFNRLIGFNLSMSYLFTKGLSGYSITIGLMSMTMAGILISGFYPAFVLSSFRPALVLKGKFSNSGKGILLRKSLVIGQFAITVALIIGSFVVYKQLRFVNSQELGMNIDQMLMVNGPSLTTWDSTFISRENSLKEEIKKLPGIKGVATTDRPMTNEMARAFNVRRKGADPKTNMTIRNFGASSEFINVYGIKLLAGRNFTPTDYNYEWRNLHNLIMNQSALKALGFSTPTDAIGQSITVFNRPWDIIGVIADFHQKSLHHAIEPMILIPTSGTNAPISIKVNPQNIQATLASIKSKYDQFFPGNMFDYYFLDQRFNEQYKNDHLFGKVFSLFAGFAIFVACLGLLGLSLYATVQRTKEVGVRKVLGASVSNIVLLLSKDFVKLVIIAFLVASPIAWFIMNNWLENFAYRIKISPWIFVLAGTLALIIALATISFQALRAAFANPVKSLRTE